MSATNEVNPASGVERLVRCVGVDKKKHLFFPECNLTYCGIGIKRKKLLRDDYKLFLCSCCDI